jgi:integrase
MQAKKQPKDRHSKGSVAILVSNDRLQLRFSYAGKRHYISLGLTDTIANRRVAEAKAKLIESDIVYERLDVTLEKYKPQTAMSVATPVTPIFTPPPKTNLADLWEKYTEFQREHLEKSTIVRDYGKIEKRIAKFPNPFLEDAIAVQSHLLSKYAAETAKRTLKQLSACCDWGIRKKLVSENPFKELAAEIKTKSRKASRVSRKPFSKECVAAILAAFENDTYCPKCTPVRHSFYAPYVKFLLHTGCRPEEAIALKWKHVEKNRIYFCDAMPTDVRIRKDTKTHAPRYFPINEELRKLFEMIRPEDCHPEMLVFPAKNGKELHTHNFLNRVWKPILERLVGEGKVRQYLPQYNCRHTFITLCLESGVPSRRVADWCGTSVAVIEEHYAGSIAHIQVPNFKLSEDTEAED